MVPSLVWLKIHPLQTCSHCHVWLVTSHYPIHVRLHLIRCFGQDRQRGDHLWLVGMYPGHVRLRGGHRLRPDLNTMKARTEEHIAVLPNIRLGRDRLLSEDLRRGRLCEPVLRVNASHSPRRRTCGDHRAVTRLVDHADDPVDSQDQDQERDSPVLQSFSLCRVQDHVRQSGVLDPVRSTGDLIYRRRVTINILLGTWIRRLVCRGCPQQDTHQLILTRMQHGERYPQDMLATYLHN